MSKDRLLLADCDFLCRERVVGVVVCSAGTTTASSVDVVVAAVLRSTLAALRVRCDLRFGSACPLVLATVCAVPFMLGVLSGDRAAPVSLVLSLVLLLFLNAGDGDSWVDFGISCRENTREGVEGRDKGIELGIRISRSCAGTVLGGITRARKAQALKQKTALCYIGPGSELRRPGAGYTYMPPGLLPPSSTVASNTNRKDALNWRVICRCGAKEILLMTSTSTVLSKQFVT